MPAVTTVGIFIFDNVEVLDFCGPFEVFSVARPKDSDVNAPGLFHVYLIAESNEQPITTNGNMQVLPQYSIDDCPQPLDVLVLPGGKGTRPTMERSAVIDFIKRQAANRETKFMAGVCTGAYLLAKANLLHNRRATTHFQCLERLQELCPSCTVDAKAQYVFDGNIVTSAGISAGIDLALMIVQKLYGADVARFTAEYMEYPFPESDRRVAH